MSQVWWESENGYINTANVVQMMVVPTSVVTTSNVTEIGAPYLLRLVNTLGEHVNIPGEYETKEEAMSVLLKMITG